MYSISKYTARQKLLALILLATTLALLSVLVAVGLYEHSTFRPRALAQLQADATVLEELLAAPLDFNQRASAEKVILRHNKDSDLKLLAVYSNQGLFTEYRREGEALQVPAAPLPDGHVFQFQQLELWWTVHNIDNEPIGHLYLVKALPPLHARLVQYAIMTGAVLFALLVVGLTLFLGLQRNVLGPVSRMMQTVNAVARSNDYGLRVKVRNQDEFGQLASAFNRMFEQIGVHSDELHQANLRLQQREEWFRSLIENANDMITVVNAEGVVTYQSPSCERILGYRVEELLGLCAFGLVHPSELEAGKAALHQALETGSNSNPVTLRLRHKNGNWRKVEIANRSRWTGNGARELILNIHDITESSRLEEELRQSQKMEAVGQLSGGVAHDFNNLLTVIMGNLSLLKEAELPAAASEAVEEIGQASQRAVNLTRQLLAFSRRQAMHLETVDLNSLVSNLARMLQRLLGEHIQVRCALNATPATVRADANMVEQVLVNLAVNARDAMPRGGRFVIETSVETVDELFAARSPKARPGSFVCISVSDTGCGIPTSIQARIFEPFFTTKEVGKGTGLGLATVYGIVEQHLGWVSLYSEEGSGTTFKVYLPLDDRPAECAAEPAESPSQVGGTETLLLVEDEASVRTLVRHTLTRLGYRVLEAASGPQALALWRDQRGQIQLLITDMVMPEGMSGGELAELILADKPGLPIIYSSGYSPEILHSRHPFRREATFLAKPYALEKLSRTVRQCLDSAGAA